MDPGDIFLKTAVPRHSRVWKEYYIEEWKDGTFHKDRMEDSPSDLEVDPKLDTAEDMDTAQADELVLSQIVGNSPEEAGSAARTDNNTTSSCRDTVRSEGWPQTHSLSPWHSHPTDSLPAFPSLTFYPYSSSLESQES